MVPVQQMCLCSHKAPPAPALPAASSTWNMLTNQSLPANFSCYFRSLILAVQEAFESPQHSSLCILVPDTQQLLDG